MITWRIGCLSLGLLLLLSWAWRAAIWLWWRPWQLERALRAQGLRGNPYRFLYGDIKESARLTKDARSRPISLTSPHRIIPRVAPPFHLAINQHGKLSFTWLGPMPTVSIIDPALIREVLFNKSGCFVKPKTGPIRRELAPGLVSHEGDKWVKHRRIVNPAFHAEKLKCMFLAFSTCSDDLIARWNNLVGSKGCHELDVWPEMQSFTGDVISRAAFGSSYLEGRCIFQLQIDLVELLVKIVQSIYFQIPGYRFLPLPQNIRRKEIVKELQAILQGVIEKRERAMKLGEVSDDLLGLLMESNATLSEEHEKSKNNGMSTEDVIEECKLFYLAGQEATSVFLTWTMVLLSIHPSWQVRAREEVLQVFGKNKPDFEGLSRLKITRAQGDTRLKKDVLMESNIRSRMQPLKEQLTYTIYHLHTIFEVHVFVLLCRGYWDSMGQDVLSFVEHQKENRSWYRAARVAVSILDDTFASQMKELLGNALKEKDLYKDLHTPFSYQFCGIENFFLAV